MTDRPTPEQIAAWPEVRNDAEGLLDNLAAHGYIIVHPDDVPAFDVPAADEASDVFQLGWDDCRRYIFGDAR